LDETPVIRKKAPRDARTLVAILSLIAFPLLVMIAFYASQKLVPSLDKFQFTPPTQPITTTSASQNTNQPPVFKETIPPFLGSSLPNLPSITYSDILILIALIVVAYACIKAFRAIIHRKAMKPLSDIDLLIEEREKVATILDETVRRLSLGSDYRDTVLKCYKLIAETLEAKSSLDSKALTAAEFREIVSRKLKFDSAHLSRVTSLFELARYSENEITKEDAGEAIECLTSLSVELRTKDFIAAG
jgi:hypothetical protein